MKKTLAVLMVVLAMVGVLSVSAQESAPRVAFGDFSFALDPALADAVNIWHVPGDPIDLEAPGGPQVKHTEFALYHSETALYEPVPTGFNARTAIRLYATADFAGYDYFQSRLADLQTLLAERPDLAEYMTVQENLMSKELPVLPVLPAGQVIRAQAQYVDTGFVQGIRFVTVYRQDASPFTRNEFLYTFQGLTLDGQFYISLIAWVAAEDFPESLPTDYDYNAFYEKMLEYFTESIAQLNAAPASNFTPSLDIFDALVESFVLDHN